MPNKITQLDMAQYYLNNNQDSWKLYNSLILTFKDVIKQSRHNREIVKICLKNIALCRELMDITKAKSRGYQGFIKIKEEEVATNTL